jgi:hypothetical protein
LGNIRTIWGKLGQFGKYKDNLGKVYRKDPLLRFSKSQEQKKKKGLHFFLEKNYWFFKKYGQNILGQIAKDNLGKLA